MKSFIFKIAGLLSAVMLFVGGWLGIIIYSASQFGSNTTSGISVAMIITGLLFLTGFAASIIGDIKDDNYKR